MSPLNVQHAVACLGQLQQHPQSANDIARDTGIPRSICADILARLEQAGIIHRDRAGSLELSDQTPSALSVLDAIWGAPPRPAFRPLYGRSAGAAHWTKQCITTDGPHG